MNITFAFTIFHFLVTCSLNLNYQRNSIKRTKSNSYSEHFHNCAKIEHYGLYNIGTHHKKFGGKKKKNENILCRVSKEYTYRRLTLPSGC